MLTKRRENNCQHSFRKYLKIITPNFADYLLSMEVI